MNAAAIKENVITMVRMSVVAAHVPENGTVIVRPANVYERSVRHDDTGRNVDWSIGLDTETFVT